jgi:hypothetical protein
MTLEEMQREQQRHLEVLNRGAAAMEAKLAGLDPQLRADALRERTAEIRAEASKTLEPLIRAMGERAKAASDAARFHTPEAELRRARFHNDDATNATMEIATFTRLARTPTAGLVELLEDAVASNKVALVEAVRLEFQGRADRDSVKDQFAAAFSKVALPNSVAATKAIGSIKSLAGFGQEKFNSAVSGRSNPVARMAAARMATA